MPILRIHRDGQEPQCLEAPEQATILDATILHRTPLPFRCMAGHCAQCAVQVTEGGDNLYEPTASEELVLGSAHLARGVRLACQARIRGALSVAPVS